MTPDDDTRDHGLQPPQDILAEQSVLGACMLARTAIDQATDEGLRGRDFYRPAHELVWDAITALTDAGEPVDGSTVLDALRRAGTLGRAGGPTGLHTLLQAPASAANAGYYARIVRERAVLRALVEAGAKVTQLGYAAHGGDVDALVGEAQRVVGEVADSRHASSTDTLHDVADRALEQIESGIVCTPTPWSGLNHLIDGWVPGCFYATGARPKTGKTIFALQSAVAFARTHADRDKLAVAYFTFEMSGPRLYARALSQVSGVDSSRMRRGGLTDGEWTAIAKADAYLRELPLTLEGASGWTPQRVIARVRQLHRANPVGLVVVDHIGLTASDRRGDNRQSELSYAADVFLALGHDLGTAVHVVTQLNRGVTQRSDPRPVPSDIRDTDRIEQNADVLMLLHRDKDNAPDRLHVAVPSNRDGDEGAVELEFQGSTARLQDVRWSPSAVAGGGRAS